MEILVELGFTYFLIKPFQDKDLIRILLLILKKQMFENDFK